MICLASNPSSSSKVIVVARREWLVYNLLKLYFSLNHFILLPKVFLPTQTFSYQILPDFFSRDFGRCQNESQFGFKTEIYFSSDFTGHSTLLGTAYKQPPWLSSVSVVSPRWFLLNDLSTLRTSFNQCRETYKVASSAPTSFYGHYFKIKS